jgi:rhomboid protease GluP
MNYFEKYKEYPLTYTLMVIAIVVFITGVLSPALDEYFYQNGIFHGYSVIVKGELHRLITSIFLHSDEFHIVFNMLSLFIVGRVVEGLFSKGAYLSLFFLTAFFGAYTANFMDLGVHAVGASGGIFGLFGALAGFAYVHRNTMRDQFVHFMKNFGLILLLNLIIGLVFPSISIAAHIGGLVSGLIGGFIMAKSPKYLWMFIVVSMVLLAVFHSILQTQYMNVL